MHTQPCVPYATFTLSMDMSRAEAAKTTFLASGTSGGTFRFGHSETLLPFMALLVCALPCSSRLHLLAAGGS